MNAQIRQDAAEWVIEFRTDEIDAGKRERFASWLRTSPEHVRAYLELAAMWEDASSYDSNRQIDVDQLVHLARAQDNVVDLEVAAVEHPTVSSVAPAVVAPAAVPSAAYSRRRYRLIAAAAVVSAAILGIWVVCERSPSYATGVGEQRTIRLADGSTAELNAVSGIRVHMSDHRRVVDLLKGQALFRVAKDATRPFIVVSGATDVVAIGTEFDVNQKPVGTVVTVLEGRVAVLTGPSSGGGSSQGRNTVSSAPAPVEVAAGDQVTVVAGISSKNQHANINAATAWTQQQLIFESTPLAEVAEEFNRFNPQKLVVGSAGLADFHVSGTFPALDPASLPRFVRFLRAQPGIQVRESDDQIVITRDATTQSNR